MNVLARVALAAALLAGCDAEAIPVYAPSMADEDWALVYDAAAILGLGVDERTEPEGVIAVTLRAHRDGEVAGFSVDSFGCYREVWAIRIPSVLAHELGHALALPHREGTIMAEHDEQIGYESTPAQRVTMRRNIRRMQRMRARGRCDG